MRTRRRRRRRWPSYGQPPDDDHSNLKSLRQMQETFQQDAIGDGEEAETTSANLELFIRRNFKRRKLNYLNLPATLLLYSLLLLGNHFHHNEKQASGSQQRLARMYQHQQQQTFTPFHLVASNPSLLAAHNSNSNKPPDLITNQGGIIPANKNVTLGKQHNPILITKDIIIKKGASLTIESGAELLFSSRRGIIVYGSLEILGQPSDRVKLNLLRSQQSATINQQFRSQANTNSNFGQHQHQQVRLVDGDTPNEGRVQIKFNNRWHSLCTSSKNLTAADINVICRQVGYQEGQWYRWFPKRNETIHQIMSKSFSCVGTEVAISQCRRWNRIRTGGGICDYHSDLGVRCSRRLVEGLGYEYWRGLEFVQAESQQEYVLEGQMRQRVSRSILTNLIISDAGMDEVGNATAAIRVVGQPPRMSHLEIRNSIYGVWVEEVEDAFKMSYIHLHDNMAAPLFINTSWGKVGLDQLRVENNGGDGVRVARHEKILIGAHDFCKFANLGSSQTFPVILSHEQTFFTAGRDCCQEFISQNQLTVHFPVLRSTPNNLLPDDRGAGGDSGKRVSIPAGVSIGKEAHLLIYDDYRDEFPFRLKVANGTRAQSVVSKSGRLKICYEPALYRTVLFTIEVVADYYDDWTGVARDLEISNSYIASNEGRGVWLENQRSGLKLINTTILGHNYLAGLHVENGTGEVIVQASQISNNSGHGIYIHQAGGYYHIDNSTISANQRRGIHLEHDPRPSLVPFNHTFHLGYSLIMANGENGLFLGNVCRSDAFWNVSMNSFIKNGEDAIFYQACWPTQAAIQAFKHETLRLNLSDPDMAHHQSHQELHITHNTFLANERRAISMVPAFFVKSLIRHNLFREHPLAVLHISNNLPSIMDHLTNQAPVNIRVASNRFYANRGRYVANLGLQEDNYRHSLVFTKNLLVDNAISEPFADLKPRSRVSAVVVVSSSNTKVIRNRFDNPLSAYELGSHLEMHSKIINATTNFWGPQLDTAAIYRRIFDRKNRYNLAQVEFLQYLLSPEDLEFASDLSFDRERDKIMTFRNGSRLGGEIKGYEELATGTYYVNDDLFVRPGAHLVLREGTQLKFQDGVGMMVQGRLDAIGKPQSQILFTSAISSNRLPPSRAAATTTPAPLANPWVSSQPEGGLESDLAEQNQTRSIKKRQVAATSSGALNARLSHTTMGRLEVLVDGVYGPVCDYNFDIDDAAVVCHQLGMILNKDDWLLERYQYASNDQHLDEHQLTMMTTSALMTNLRCDPSLDTDITRCKAELSSRGDFDGVCSSEVGIRCFPPSWSGLRLGMGAEVSSLEHVTIQKAGMFDYASYQLKPALQVDFNRHWISSLSVKYNSDSGMGIMWNDVIGRHHSDLILSDSKFHNNERHGLELRSKGLTLRGCSLSANRQNGLDYNPSFQRRELHDLLSWLHTPKNWEHIVSLNFPLQSTSTRYYQVPSNEDSYRFFVLRKNPPANLPLETFTIGTDPGHMLSIQLLHPIHPDSSEQLNMSIGLNPESPVWNFRVNMTSFPMVSSGYKFYFNYSTGSKPRGNIILYIRSRYNSRDLKSMRKFIPAHLMTPKFENTANNINAKLLNSLTISDSNITRNGIGLRFQHHNHFFSGSSHSMEEFNLRYANETTNITNNLFDSNYVAAIFVGSDDLMQIPSNDSLQWPVPASEINYNLLGNRIRRNKDGIRQFSRDIRSSNNVFHWSIQETSYELNKGGGINLLLPYFWPYDANLSHSIDLSQNNFSRNVNFELSLDGHFARLNLTKNIFRENRCRSKLISLVGMEKEMRIAQNSIEHNTCDRVLDFNIQSHADKLGQVGAQFEFNSVRHNKLSSATSLVSPTRQTSRWLAKLNPLAASYALCLKSVQAVNITRNLFVNPELPYELVVAIVMDPEERTVNAAENYWGTVVPGEINERIFDFDDWNSFAVAETSPHLTLESFVAATMVEAPRYPIREITTTMGGRLTKSLILKGRKEPYLIESDLTVMPNVTLTIERGASLEFMPNVGILVLGSLQAAGTRDQPIQMRPALSAQEVAPFRRHLLPARLPYSQLNQADPLEPSNYYSQRSHHQLAHQFPIDMGPIRLCKNEICNDGQHLYENNVEEPALRLEALRGLDGDNSTHLWKMDGFLEVFNLTTLQWAPVCDPLFTEHMARVVCRQLGYNHFSLFRRGRRYTIEQERLASIRSWPASVRCEGDELNLSSCPLASDNFLHHHSNHSCSRESNQFVYIYCRDFPEVATTNPQLLAKQHEATSEHLNHWGGLRFSCPSSEDQFKSKLSRLQYVSVERAGMLHRKRAPAIQVLQCGVQMEYVAVTSSAHHGLEIISSQGEQNLHQLRLRNNLGVGLNHVSLTGSSSASRLVPYLPLKRLDLSGDIYGLVDICGANKEIQVGERLLLFYHYSPQPVDCLKIITSKLPIKHIGVRMLHFDLFNSSAHSLKPDSLRIYDGNIYDRDSRLLAELGVTERHRQEKPELKFYQSSDHTMSLRMHTSGGGPQYGFLAEVVTTPVAYNIQRNAYNNLTFSELANNRLGAMTVASAGESSPNLILKNNRFDSNCLHLFGNFTSCTSAIYMELQNCQRLLISDNLIKNNQGGLTIKSYSHSAVSALEGHIEGNVFESNQNLHVLALLGPKTDPYQTVRVSQNFITRNVAQYLPNIVLSRIVANFSHNIISGNRGKHQIEVIGFDKLPLSQQTIERNWIYNNSATLERDRATISGNSAGQQYYQNLLVNPDNHFELSTMNWSRYDVKPFHLPKDDEIIHLMAGDGSSKELFRKTADAIPISIIDTKRSDLYHATIQAKHNWWGFATEGAIRARINDRKQHEELIGVEFKPYLESNQSVLSAGICAGGWRRVGDACLVYVGSRMSYLEAREFCDRELATLPLLRGNHYELADFLKQQRADYDARIDRIWVRSFEVAREDCPALNYYRTRNYHCEDRYAFVCEKDPQPVVSMMYWYRETGGLIALILASITMALTVCCTICGAYKSRERHKEKLQRKNSMRSLQRSGYLAASASSSANNLSELFLHRQLYNQTSDAANAEKSSIGSHLSMSTQLTPTSELVTASNQVRLEPAYSGGRSRKPYESAYYNAPAKPIKKSRGFSPQPAENPAYVSPSPLGASKYSKPPKTPTPVPSYQHKKNGSRTPSYSSDIFPEPMPVLTAPAYSQINHTLQSQSQSQSQKKFEQDEQQREFYRKRPGEEVYNYPTQQQPQIDTKMAPIEGSESSVPTYYSSQLETAASNGGDYAQSYLEAYNEAYQQTLQRITNNGHLTTTTTERQSSYTDLLLIRSSNPALASLQSGGKQQVATPPPPMGDLISMAPQGPDYHQFPAAASSAADLLEMNGSHNNRAYHSETMSANGSQRGGGGSGYLVETSFDQEQVQPAATAANIQLPRPAAALSSMFGGSSQRLSPVSSSSFGQATDSKHGSRVYLETSFE